MNPRSNAAHHHVLALLLAAALSLTGQREAQASAFASSDIGFSGFNVTPAQGTFTLVSPPVLATGFSEALNSLGEHNSSSDSSSGGLATTAASVTWAAAAGVANAAAWTANASTAAGIPLHLNASSSATGLGTLATTFEIVAPGSGPVNVGFGVDLATSLSVLTDQLGVLARAESIFDLEVDGIPLLFHDEQLQIGPSSSATAVFTAPLFQNLSLDLNTDYSLLIQVDSETHVQTTVPDSLGAFGGFSLLLLVAADHWRRQRRPNCSAAHKGGRL